MKIPKSLLLILLLSFGLTGCYTQLEYSQKMQRVTDEKSNAGYTWSNEGEEKANLTEADSIYIAETYGAKVSPYREGEGEYAEEGEYYYEDDEYIPIEYKKYDVIDTYEACGCNPYKTYVIYNSYSYSPWYYGSSYYHYNRFHHWPSYYAFGYPHYSWRYNFGFNYYHRGFGLAFHWGSPYHYYYDPFFYDPFYYGYSSPIFYNTYYFGSGYAGNLKNNRDDRRYGRRSIGTDRVRDGNSTAVRTRSAVNRGSKANTNTVRTRTTGVQRTRGTVGTTRGTTVRSRGANVGSSDRNRSGNTRSRGTIKRSRGNGNDGGSSVRNRRDSNVNVTGDPTKDRERVSDSRARVGINRSGILLPSRADRSQIENKIRRQRVEIKQLRDNQQRSRSSFFGRFKNFIDTDRSFKSSRSHYGRSYKNSSNSRSRINTGKSRSSSRSSVTRSRSSSKSSSTRSRSSGGSSSDNKRSRGNN